MGDEQISNLRALAHPVRLRILSLLTAQAMSAAEVARELELTHANASYHLRVLHQVGELVVESEEKIRGGVAKRYRYLADRNPDAPTRPAPGSQKRTNEDYIAYARSSNAEVVRRLASKKRGRMTDSDIETWVSPETWERAVALLHEATMLLHEGARPRGTADAVHVSATVIAFTMDDQR